MKGFERTVDLFNAAEQGNLSEVKSFFSMGADVLARNGHHTVLHSAVCSDNREVVELFLNKITETQGSVIPFIDAKDTEGDTPLMWTAASCYINAARILLEYGADVEAKNHDGKTALHWAAKTNHIEIIRLLIGRGTNINVNDKYGKKPLDYAKEEGHKEIVGYLVLSEAEILRKEGKYNEAWQAYQEAISIQEDVLGSDHLDTLMTHHNMAEVLASQGKHSEALQIFQKLYDIQKRRNDLDDNHPHTLMTLFNMAVEFSEQGNNNEVSKIFQEILDIKGVKIWSDYVTDLMLHYKMMLFFTWQANTNVVSKREILRIQWAKMHSDPLNTKIKKEKKMSIESNSLEERGDKPETYHDISREKFRKFVKPLHDVTKTISECQFSNECSSSKSYQEAQKLEEEYLVSKHDDIEAMKKGITEHIKDRFFDVFIVRGKDRGKSAWHYALIDPDKKEKFHEKTKTGSLDVADYGKVLYSGFGENPPQNINDNVDDFFKKKFSNLFVIKKKFENMIFYHYVLIETDKTNIKNNGRVIYSGCGQDPPEVIGNKIISTYFGINEKKIEEEFANLNVEESKTFHDAVRNGKLEALRSFAGENSVDINGWTPLHHAAYVGNKKAVEYLISIGVNLKVREAVLGRMPVHIAAREGHNDTLELLLNKSLKIYDVDENGWTPLHYATWGGHFNLTKLLIEKGFDIHAKEATRGKKPIHIAAERGYMNIVKFLLKSGAEIDDTDRDGRTSLYYASWKGHLDIVKYLAGREADIHAKNIFGSVPIHIASSGGHVNIIEYLLNQGAKVYDLNNSKYAPLHFAAKDGHLGTVDFLLYRGANVNDSAENKYTPLHFAAQEGRLEVVKFLLTKGAEIEVRNNDGKTPSDLARANGYTMVADILDG